MLVSGLLWFALDMMHSASIDNIVHANIASQLRRQAEMGTARFRTTLMNYFNATTLLAASRPVADQVAQAVAQPDGPGVVRPMSALGVLADPLERSEVSLVTLIDGQGRMLRSFGNQDSMPPPGLDAFLRAIPVNAAHRSIVQQLGGQVYVICVLQVPETVARVVLLAHWDAKLIARSQGMLVADQQMAAIADIFHGTVAASGDPVQVPPGMPLSELENNWLSIVHEFPDHGGRDFLPAFVTLVPRSYVDQLAGPLLRQEREQRTMLAATLIGLLLVVMGMLGTRLRRVIDRMAVITGTVTGLPAPMFRGGDEMRALIRQVEVLATEVKRSRYALEQEVEEKLRLGEEQAQVREENSRLRLLQAVTDLLKVGVLRVQHDVPLIQNKAMDDFAQLCGGLDAFVDSEARRNGELVVPLAEGNRIFSLHSADKVAEGMILVTDITERRRAEQMIHSLALFPAQCPYPVLRISADGVILHGNPASEPLMGEWATGIGRPVPPQWHGVIAEVLDANRQVKAELAVAGSVLSLSLVPVSGGGYVNIYAADVSDRVAVERELALANEGLERRVAERTRDLEWAKEQAELASRSKTEFLATISHELRTPLNAIIGFSEVMAGSMFGPLGNARYQGYATDIVNSGRHLLAVINDILDVSKIEAGQMTLEMGPVDIGAVVDSALRLVETRARGGGVRLEAEIAADLPALVADRRRCLQILVNLLSNAVKFTAEGGSVTLAAAPSGEGIALHVRDTGIGMTADEIAVALEPFRQVDGSLARQYEGTGLGLPLARSMAELHGGALTVDSRKGEGTTVTVWLPLRAAGQDTAGGDWEI